MITKKIGQAKRPIADILADFKQPVDPKLISQKPVYRQKRKVGEVSYIHWYTLVDELEKIAPGWNFQIRTQFLPDRCVIEGRLTIKAEEGDFTREATGVEMLDSNGYGDPVYSAEASALRRAMAKFGYALDLWRKDKKAISSDIKQLEANRKITQAQINRLFAIAKSVGLGRDEIQQVLMPFNALSPKDILMRDYDLVVKRIEQAKPKPIYSSWKDGNDALEWAMSELPGMHMNRLTQEWLDLRPVMVDGKPSKAIAWVNRIEEIKSLPF